MKLTLSNVISSTQKRLTVKAGSVGPTIFESDDTGHYPQSILTKAFKKAGVPKADYKEFSAYDIMDPWDKPIVIGDEIETETENNIVFSKQIQAALKAELAAELPKLLSKVDKVVARWEKAIKDSGLSFKDIKKLFGRYQVDNMDTLLEDIQDAVSEEVGEEMPDVSGREMQIEINKRLKDPKGLYRQVEIFEKNAMSGDSYIFTSVFSEDLFPFLSMYVRFGIKAPKQKFKKAIELYLNMTSATNSEEWNDSTARIREIKKLWSKL